MMGCFINEVDGDDEEVTKGGALSCPGGLWEVFC